jgi:aminoglycoside phosphotransferase (APT) family kinase protein
MIDEDAAGPESKASTADFLRQRHSEFSTPRDEVFELASRATGSDTRIHHKIVDGYDNEVYRVEMGDGQVVFVRIRRFGERTLEQEAWAMEQCRIAGVPVPDVLHLDSVSIESDQQLEAMVVAEVEGESLSAHWESLTERERNQVVAGAGQVLSKIHSVEVDGFYLRRSGKWDFPDWESLMASAITGRSKERELVQSAGFTPADFDFMVRMLERYRDEFPCRQPVLCHGDYLPAHIFIDDSLQITSIIDFGMYEGNSPIHDFVFLGDRNLNPQWIMEGYEDKGLFDQTFPVRLLLHKVALGMGYVAHNVKIDDVEQARTSARRLAKAIESLRNL